MPVEIEEGDCFGTFSPCSKECSVNSCFESERCRVFTLKVQEGLIEKESQKSGDNEEKSNGLEIASQSLFENIANLANNKLNKYVKNLEITWYGSKKASLSSGKDVLCEVSRSKEQISVRIFKKGNKKATFLKDFMIGSDLKSEIEPEIDSCFDKVFLDS